jgi:signal transduction histidine kinase
MTLETQRNIFEKFYREEIGNVHNVKGFGLGLAYVKSIVKKHGGDIRVQSEKGKGTASKVFLPFGHHKEIRNNMRGNGEGIKLSLLKRERLLYHG